MPNKRQIDPRERPPRTHSPDLAASHARALLESCGLPLEIPDRTDPPSPALEWARSGAMALTGPASGEPRFAAGPLASAASGAGMVLRALAPQSALAKLDAPALFGERAAIAGLRRNGNASVGGAARLLATRTGFIAVNLPRPEDWQLAPAWLEAECSGFASTRDWKGLAGLLADRDAESLVERGRIMGLAIANAPTTIPNDRPLFTLNRLTQSSPVSPKRRLRLLDLSNLWAGPLAASLLATAGIEVLKIESPIRPDGARNGPEAFFQLLNGNKHGCALDLNLRAERDTFLRLLENADIVVESSRSRALEQFGIHAEDWVQARAGRLWASITGYGRSRPWIAFGDDAAVAAGLAWSPLLDSSSPAFCGDAIADPLAGVTLAAVLLALSRGGRGGLIDLALADCVAGSAALGCDRLTLPLENRPEGWCVLDAGLSTPIEKPRARKHEAAAPALARPNASLLARWIKPC